MAAKQPAGSQRPTTPSRLAAKEPSTASEPTLFSEQLLRLLMGLLVGLGAILLGMGQQNLMLPILMLFAVATSLIFTDYLGWFRLHRTVANLAAVVAVLFSLSDFLRSDTQRQLLAIAHLLVYLQVVLLYQSKSTRIYWQLAVLSLLQVVVGAALNVGFEFGAILIVFAGIAFFALGVFFVHRTCSQLRSAQAPEPRKTTKRSIARRSAQAELLLGSRLHAEPQASSEAIGRELLSRGFVQHILGMGLATLVFTAVFFYCTPRTLSSSWRNAHGHKQIVGFSNEVELNEVGRILQSDELVMRARFYDAESGAPVPTPADVYFRGMVLGKYLSQLSRSKWSNQQAAHARPGEGLPKAASPEGLLLQEVLLQPSGQSLLFSVAPAYQLESTGIGRNVRLDRPTQQLFRYRGEGPELRIPYRFVIATDAFQQGVQSRYRTVSYSAKTRAVDERRLAVYNDELRNNFPIEEFPELARKAQLLVSRAGELAASPLQRARVLESHFQTSDDYRYTLDFRNVKRNPNLDPIEDFVSNHGQGHCEYFASALTMMLRSQGVPARVVIGYRGGETNQLGGYLQVRQRSAHAWVEAFIDRDDLPSEIVDAADGPVVGAWMRLDPTPGASQGDQITEENTLLGGFGQALDYAQLLWSDYVLGLNSETQVRAGLEPFRRRQRGERPPDGVVASWLRQLGEWVANAGFDMTKWQWQDLVSWRAGLAAMAITAALLVLWNLAAIVKQRLPWPRQRARRQHARQGVRVEFYERLEGMLLRCGLQREPHQTQQEFVVAAAGNLDLQHVGSNVGQELRWLVDRFYEVRFGQRGLDKTEIDAIEHSLRDLEQLLAADQTPVQKSRKRDQQARKVDGSE